MGWGWLNDDRISLFVSNYPFKDFDFSFSLFIERCVQWYLCLNPYLLYTSTKIEWHQWTKKNAVLFLAHVGWLFPFHSPVCCFAQRIDCCQTQANYFIAWDEDAIRCWLKGFVNTQVHNERPSNSDSLHDGNFPSCFFTIHLSLVIVSVYTICY